MLLSCDVLSFERVGHVLRLQPAMLATVWPIATVADLAPISGSKQPANVLEPKCQTGAGKSSLRRRAPASHLRADRNGGV